MNHEKELFSQVEALREQFPSTQELYREVAALLFFRFGVTPTANRLYQLVRKGSMSAPAEALRQFWAALREKSQVRMDHADIPDNLKNQVAQLVGQFWQEAQNEAKQSFLAFQADCEVQVDKAQEQAIAAEQGLRACQTQLEHEQADIHRLTQALQAAAEKRAGLEAALQAEQSRTQALLEHNQSLETKLDTQALRFTQELQKLQQAIELSEERSRQSEKRALLEIDRERQAHAEFKKQLSLNVHKAEQQQLEYVSTLEQKEQALGALRQELGQLQGQEKATHQALLESQQQHALVQEHLHTLRTQHALVQQEHSQQTKALQELQAQLIQMQQAPEPIRLRRRNRL